MTTVAFLTVEVAEPLFLTLAAADYLALAATDCFAAALDLLRLDTGYFLTAEMLDFLDLAESGNRFEAPTVFDDATAFLLEALLFLAELLLTALIVISEAVLLTLRVF